MLVLMQLGVDISLKQATFNVIGIDINSNSSLVFIHLGIDISLNSTVVLMRLGIHVSLKSTPVLIRLGKDISLNSTPVLMQLSIDISLKEKKSNIISLPLLEAGNTILNGRSNSTAFRASITKYQLNTPATT